MSIQMNDNSQSQKISLKFLTLGDSKIGKTSILERYVNKTFKDNYLVTIGMDIRIKRLTINDNNIDIHVTDTAGQERFRSISKMSYKRSDGILVGFALNDQKTFESISYWIEQIYENKGKNSDVSVVLFGNKCDDKENIVVKEEEINKIKNKYNLQYFETSAKENINVKELFEHLIRITIVNKGLLKNFGLNENASIDNNITNIQNITHSNTNILNYRNMYNNLSQNGNVSTLNYNDNQTIEKPTLIWKEIIQNLSIDTFIPSTLFKMAYNKPLNSSIYKNLNFYYSINQYDIIKDYKKYIEHY